MKLAGGWSMRRIGIAFLGMACLGALACEERSPLTDATLTQEVANRLEADRELGPYDLGVATDAGVVTLSGRVGDEAQREEAERLARDVVGVGEVVNQLDVMAPGDPTVH
jgi:hypothetical protein